jgi:hypothetical protein
MRRKAKEVWKEEAAKFYPETSPGNDPHGETNPEGLVRLFW